MAHFQASGSGTDETSSTPAGRPKQPLQPTFSSGPTIQTKNPFSECLSGSAINIPPKPTSWKNTIPTNGDTVVRESNRGKAMASRFDTTQDDTNINSKPLIGNKQQIPMKPPPSQRSEAKGPGPKLPLNKPSLGSTLSNSKPAFPKPSPSVSRPSWIKDDSGGGGAPATTGSAPKIPPLQQKPSSSLLKLWQQNEEQGGAKTDAANKPSNFRTAQNMFNKEKDKNEQPDSGGTNRPPLCATNSIPPPKPSVSKKPSLRGKANDSPQPSGVNGDATLGPKHNPIPNILALGPAPAKPNRPPRVNLEKFKRGAEASDDGPGTFRKSITPTPQSSHLSNHSNHVAPPPPPQAALPSLPPHHPGSMIQQEEFYDDVDEIKNSPPPLPPPSAHPSHLRAKEETDNDDGEMYDDLDERWEANEQEKKKDAKEEKKRLDAERKEQKEREKKEQDARKKFKLVGPLEVVHRGKSCVDCRGNKTDLGLKQGECLDIIRVQGNPEGKWLGRTQDGSIGYVKTTSVEIDFNTLKNRQAPQTYDPEVYDDIDVVSTDNSGFKGPGVALPPLPGGEGGEIYDDVVDPNLEVSPLDARPSPLKPRSFLRMFERSNRPASTKVVPPPTQFNTQRNSDLIEDDEIYDDVDSQNVTPPISSFPILKGKSKTEEMDPKKQKKFEKEEKDFRKKFKYDGEVEVLYEVTIVHTLTNKKWTGKELPVKAGEKLDVIVKAVDNKLICRNEEGKFGYVSTSHIVTDDGDIYDDIGDGI
ncbi:putative FYN-binding protein [Scophthalmus maximus]|uniref:FYN-binding protein 1 n=1 Tax=Scophthalmus maximus TaxID=52904 RepID=A0A2U9CHD9_SCOMX|nr:putative FYN-binding protein [Scophthalmus maximus]